MSLAEELARPTGGRQYDQCPVGTMLVDMPDDEERQITLLALGPSGWSNAALAEVLTRHGYEMTSQQLGRHRRGGCGERACPAPSVGIR